MKINLLRKTFVFLCLGYFVSQITYSQENYISGYVVNTKNDTIKGYVDYRNWGKNPNKIHFKKTTDANAMLYSSTDIVAFGVKLEHYVSGEVQSEISPNKTDNLQDYPNINTKWVKTFLRALYQGEKSLYIYKDSDGKENFYIKQNGNYQLLNYKKYISRDKIYKHDFNISENKKYLGQLKFLRSVVTSI